MSKESKLKLTIDRKRRGVCARCGLFPATDRSYNCESCSRRFANRSKDARKERIKNGLCPLCGKNPPVINMYCCENCQKGQYKRGISAHYRHFFLHAAHRRLGQYDRKVAFGLWCIWKKQRGLCSLTGEKLTDENSALDHIIPISKGGTDDLSNLRWLTREANIAKQALSDQELFDLCKKILVFHGKI